MKPSELEHDDHISIAHRDLSGTEFRVSDTEVEDIGITEIVAVTLLSGCTRYYMAWAKGTDSAELECLDSEDAESWNVPLDSIEQNP